MSGIAGQQQASFKVVFEGRFSPGRDRASVQKAFRTRFGEANTQSVFSGRRVTLKGGLTQKQASQFQQELAKLGMLTVVAPFGASAGTPRPAALQAASAAADDASAPKADTAAELDATFKGRVTAPPTSRRHLLARWLRRRLLLALAAAARLLSFSRNRRQQR